MSLANTASVRKLPQRGAKMTDEQRELLTEIIAQQDPDDDTSDILEACLDLVPCPEEDDVAAFSLMGEIIELIDVRKAGA